MDQLELRHQEEDDTPTMITAKAALAGLAVGSIWGAIDANLFDSPQVEKKVARPGLMRTLKGCGNYGLTFAAFGGIYMGVEQMLSKHRMKRDSVNSAAAGFVAGASVFGLKGRSISAGILAGTAVAVASVLVDFTLGTARDDVVKKPSTH